MGEDSRRPAASGPGILLDRDGTLIEERHFLVDEKEIAFIDGAVDACRQLQQAGFRIVIVTNQSGVARGLLGRRRLESIHDRLHALLAQQGVELDGILYCPHHPAGLVSRYAIPCRCRKPAPGLVETALAQFGLDPCGSYIVGDSPRDLACARAWPIRRILVLTGHGRAALDAPELEVCPPHHVAADLAAAARWILALSGDHRPESDVSHPDRHQRAGGCP